VHNGAANPYDAGLFRRCQCPKSSITAATKTSSQKKPPRTAGCGRQLICVAEVAPWSWDESYVRGAEFGFRAELSLTIRSCGCVW
jgi:hypothetical protein